MNTLLQPQARPGAPAATLALLTTLLLEACTEPVPPAAGEAAQVARAARTDPYPDLSRVPPRPQLGYTVEQRREIVHGLVSDRAHARYEGGTLRHRVFGTPAPLPPVVPPAEAPAPKAAVPPLVVEAVALEESARTETRSGSLSDFLDWLLAPAAGDAATDPAALAVDPGGVAGAADLPQPRPASKAEAAGDGPAAPLAATLRSGNEETPRLRSSGTMVQPQASPAAGASSAVVGFVFTGASLSEEVRRRLEALLAGPGDGPVVIVAQGSGPAASLERARRVAQELVALGVDPRRIELQPSGPGELVWVKRPSAVTISAAVRARTASDFDD